MSMPFEACIEASESVENDSDLSLDADINDRSPINAANDEY